jgi:hypothetical protein
VRPLGLIMSEPYRLLLGVLGVWRITHLFQAEDGPGNVIVRIRRAAGDSPMGRLLDCFYCLSLWVSLPVALIIGQSVIERALLWLALSTGAILLERVISERVSGDDSSQRPARFLEDKEV